MTTNITEKEIHICGILEKNLKKCNLYDYKKNLKKSILEVKLLLGDEPTERQQALLKMCSIISQELLWNTFEEAYRDKASWDKLFQEIVNQADMPILEIDHTNGTEVPQGGNSVSQN